MNSFDIAMGILFVLATSSTVIAFIQNDKEGMLFLNIISAILCAILSILLIIKVCRVEEGRQLYASFFILSGMATVYFVDVARKKMKK